MDCTYVPDIMHFLDEYWDDPNAFNPERYICVGRQLNYLYLLSHLVTDC